MTAAPPARRSSGGWRLLRWLLGTLALLILLALALLSAPAGILARLLDQPGSEMRLLNPAGRLHAGSGELLLQGESLGRLRWQLQPAGLLRGSLQTRLELSAPAHGLTGQARLTAGGLHVEGAEGRLDRAGLDALLNPYDIYPSGQVTLTDLRFRLAADGSTQDAHGDLNWSGGRVTYLLAGQQWHADFPPLRAELRQAQGEPPRLDLLDDTAQPLLDVSLDEEGWAHLRIRYRFIAMAGFPWPDGPPPDTVLIELSEQLWN